MKNSSLIFLGIAMLVYVFLFGFGGQKESDKIMQPYCEDIAQNGGITVITRPYAETIEMQIKKGTEEVYTYEFTCTDLSNITHVKRVVAGDMATARMLFNSWVCNELGGNYSNLIVNIVYDPADAAEYGDRYKSLDGAADYLADG